MTHGITNTIEQEQENRHAYLYSDFLATMYRKSDPFGHQWVEVVDSREIRFHSRYYTTEGPYEIIQTMILETRAARIQRPPAS